MTIRGTTAPRFPGVLILGTVVAGSGYLFTGYVNNMLVTDDVVRAATLVSLFGLTILCTYAASRKTHIPAMLFLLALPIAYMVAIGVMTQRAMTWGPAAMRWATYGAVALWFYNASDADRKLRVLIGLIAVLLVVQGWVDWLLGRGLFLNGVFRIGGSVGSAIGFAGALAVAGFLSFHQWMTTGRRSFAVWAVLCGATIILTGTRSILAGYVALLPLYYAMQAPGIVRRTMRLAVGGTIALAFSLYVAATTDLAVRFMSMQSTGIDSSSAFRFALVNTVLRDFSGLERIVGLGMGGFPVWFETQTGIARVAPHFEVVWLWTEGGLIGALLYVTVLFAVSTKLVRRSSLFPSCRQDCYLLLAILWLPQTALQFANPSYFFQIMIPLAAALGVTLSRLRACHGQEAGVLRRMAIPDRLVHEA